MVARQAESRIEELSDQRRHGNNAGGPILAVCPDGLITKANQQARRVFGREEPLEGENLGSALVRVMVGHGLPSQRLHLQLLDEGGELREVLLVLSDEERQRPQLRLVPSPDDARPQDGEPATEDAPSAADFIAHELRNNLAITLGLSQVLETNFERLDASDRLSAVHGIQLEAHYALQVLDGLLKLVESRHKTQPMQPRVPVHAVVRRVVSDHRRRYTERTIRVTGDEPVFATGNSTWMQIAIGNLLSNAEKVTPAEKAIQLDLHQDGGRVVVLVLDDGKALTPPAYEGLWDIYVKGPPPGIELSGSGIGLSLCKELVQAMGGRVWAGPRNTGGSAFAISLQGAVDQQTGLAAAA